MSTRADAGVAAARAQAARLEAVKVLEVANNTVLHRLHFIDAPAVVDVRVAPALEWALEKLAAQRPADPVQGLATLLRMFEVEQRKIALGLQRPGRK